MGRDVLKDAPIKRLGTRGGGLTAQTPKGADARGRRRQRAQTADAERDEARGSESHGLRRYVGQSRV
jgi:hypothetical protein